MQQQARIHKLGTEWWAIKNDEQYNPYNHWLLEKNKLSKIDPESLKIEQGQTFIHLGSGRKHTCRSVIKKPNTPARIFIPENEGTHYAMMGQKPSPAPVFFTPDQVSKFAIGTIINVKIEGNLATIV